MANLHTPPFARVALFGVSPTQTTTAAGTEPRLEAAARKMEDLDLIVL